MTTHKTPTPIDTTAGSAAYALALAHQSVLAPRLPVGTIGTLGANLTLLGAALPTTPASGPTTPAPPPAPAPPTLVEATTTAVALITAIHSAIRGAKTTVAVRRAYGAAGKATKAPKAVVAEAAKILTQAKNNPSQALILGILPSNVEALSVAVSAVIAAEALAKSKGGTPGTTAKERHAAEVRMHQAVDRIAGVGVLAFATNATVRAQFEALVPKRKTTAKSAAVPIA